MRIVRLIPGLLLTWLLLPGCTSPPAPEPESAAPAEEPYRPDPQNPPQPEWCDNIPWESGVAFYAVGANYFRTPEDRVRAVRQADANARRQLSDTVKAVVRNATRDYARGTLTEDGDVPDESLSQDITVAVSNFALMNGREVLREFEDSTAFSLVRISFDELLDALVTEFSNAIEKVQTVSPQREAERRQSLALKLRDAQAAFSSDEAPPVGMKVEGLPLPNED